MEITKEVIAKEDIIVPGILYKYRSWSNVRHKTILSLKTVYLAPPSSFEDEMEFRNFKRYDLMNDEEIYSKYLQFSRERNLNFTEEQHHLHAKEWVKRAPFKDPDYLKMMQEDQYNQYDERIGILSLTEFNNSFSMWNYYAGKGYGLCVGLNAKILFDYIGGGGKVDYPPNGLPIINGNDDFDLERWKQVFNKEPKWVFEQEYRVHTFNPLGLTKESRAVELPPECYAEVLFGWNMNLKEKKKIIKVCQSVGINVTYYQSVINGKSVSIVPFLR